MESDDFTRHYIIRYLSARELVLPPLVGYHELITVECQSYSSYTMGTIQLTLTIYLNERHCSAKPSAQQCMRLYFCVD